MSLAFGSVYLLIFAVLEKWVDFVFTEDACFSV